MMIAFNVFWLIAIIFFLVFRERFSSKVKYIYMGVLLLTVLWLNWDNIIIITGTLKNFLKKSDLNLSNTESSISLLPILSFLIELGALLYDITKTKKEKFDAKIYELDFKQFKINSVQRIDDKYTKVEMVLFDLKEPLPKKYQLQLCDISIRKCLDEKVFVGDSKEYYSKIKDTYNQFFVRDIISKIDEIENQKTYYDNGSLMFCFSFNIETNKIQDCLLDDQNNFYINSKMVIIELKYKIKNKSFALYAKPKVAVCKFKMEQNNLFKRLSVIH